MKSSGQLFSIEHDNNAYHAIFRTQSIFCS